MRPQLSSSTGVENVVATHLDWRTSFREPTEPYGQGLMLVPPGLLTHAATPMSL